MGNPEMPPHEHLAPSGSASNYERTSSDFDTQSEEANGNQPMVTVVGEPLPENQSSQRSSYSHQILDGSGLSPGFHVGGRLRPRHRRRAATACQLCRVRKTKCDNGRPSCGYCLFQGASCIYNDKPSANASTLSLSTSIASPHRHDVSNAILLDRISHLTTLVEDLHGNAELRSQHGKQLETVPIQSQASSIQSKDVEQPLYNRICDADVQPGSAFTDDGFGKLEVSEVAARTSSCESILKWPTIQNIGQIGHVTSFALQSTVNNELLPESVLASARSAVREDEIWPLCRKFLVLIHVKNPILDVAEFKCYARQAAECGPTWDGRGCLILLACALACLANSYSPTQDLEVHGYIGSPSLVRPSMDESCSEAYFAAAMRRLSLLSSSLISIQCQYFAGLYLKFSIRPFSAWTLLQQACVRLQAYLYAKAISMPLHGTGTKGTRHIEQRLYWSCVKAECELRAELQLPASGLLQFKYPDLFPSLSFPPPSENQDFADGFAGSAGQSPANQMGGTPSSCGYLEPEEERSWLYYLAEISLRRIMNRILEALYSNGEFHWLTDIARLTSQHAAFYEELIIWRAHLPQQIQFYDGEMSSNELAFFLKTRYLGCLEWISRPFLYHAASQPVVNPSTMQAMPLSLAQQCIDTCVSLISIISRHHRHGGIWALLRKSFSAALLLMVGAQRSDILKLPDDWKKWVHLTASTIRAWEGDASDLLWMRQTLEKLLEST